MLSPLPRRSFYVSNDYVMLSSLPKCNSLVSRSGDRLDCSFSPCSNIDKFGAILSHLPEKIILLRDSINEIATKKAWVLRISPTVIELPSCSMRPLQFLQMIEKCVVVIGNMIGGKRIPHRDCLPSVDECWDFLSLVGILQDKCEFKSATIDWFCEHPRPAGFELLKYIIVLLTYPGLISEVTSRVQLFNTMKSSVSNDIDVYHSKLYDTFASRDIRLMNHTLNWFRYLVLSCFNNVLTDDVIEIIKRSLIKSSEEDCPCMYCSEFHTLKYCHYVHNFKCQKCENFMLLNDKSEITLFLHSNSDLDLMCNDCNLCVICGDFVAFVDGPKGTDTECSSCKAITNAIFNL
jgi:hypothetical protein